MKSEHAKAECRKATQRGKNGGNGNYSKKSFQHKIKKETRLPAENSIEENEA